MFDRSPNRIGIVTTDNMICIGNTAISGIRSDMSWVPSDVLEFWWDGTKGTIEYNDGKTGIEIESLPSVYNQAKVTYDLENKRNTEYASSNHKAMWMMREKRTFLLNKSDWTRLDDNGLSNSKKTEWATYRQVLRDLPANTSDPKNPTWPTEPS